MANNLGQVEVVNIIDTVDTSDFYTIDGGKTSWTFVNERSNPGFATNSISHFWTIVGAYSDTLVDRYNLSYSDEGGFLGTSLEGLYDAYYTNGFITGFLDTETYREAIDGSDIALRISISGGTGPISGLTATTLYSTFFNQPQMLKRQNRASCAPTLADSLTSETLQDATVKSGIGQSLGNTNSGSDYRSEFVFLFNDYLSFTTGSTTGQSFSTGHMVDNPYSNGKVFAEFTGLKYHRAVGAVDLTSGIVCLWDEYLVNSFAWGLATGGTGTTLATFPPNINYLNIKDIDSSVKADIMIQALPEQFYTTTNPSWPQAIKAGVPCEEQIKVSSVCLYDGSGNCTAIGVVSDTIEKTKDGFLIANLSVTLDGGITTPYSSTVVYPT